MKALLVILGILIIAAIAIYYWGDYGTEPMDEVVVCTADAMMCPDGSYVGRVPPNCEFDTCPVVQSTSTAPTTTPTTTLPITQ